MTPSPRPDSDQNVHPQPSQPGTQALAEIVPFPSSATLGEVLAALTYALDFAAKERPGYALRCCIVGMNMGRRLELPPEQSIDLFYALLLSGLGTSHEQTTTCEWMGLPEATGHHALRGFDWNSLEWPRVRFLMQYAFRDKTPLRRALGVAGLLPRRQIASRLLTRRSFAGVRLARELGIPSAAIEAMQSMDERWDGTGTPRGLRYEAIPLLSHICCVAQELVAFGDIMGQAQAVALVERRSGRWYDPGVVVTAITMHEAGTLWNGTGSDDLLGEVLARDTPPHPNPCDDRALETICTAVAAIIDSRSKYTALHSRGVAQVAARIGAEMGLTEREMKNLRCAALLHDIGKLTIPDEVLEKAGPLTEDQWSSMRRSPVESYKILKRIQSFESIALIARSHHERLDGSGYPDGLLEHQISRLPRILAVAEAYQALSSPRPYRNDYTEEQVLALLSAQVPQALDASVFEALKRSLPAHATKQSPEEPHSTAPYRSA